MQPFDARWPCPFAPLSTLRLPPHSDRRMTRGEGGRLLLPSAGLPPAVLRQLAWRTPGSARRPRLFQPVHRQFELDGDPAVPQPDRRRTQLGMCALHFYSLAAGRHRREAPHPASRVLRGSRFSGRPGHDNVEMDADSLRFCRLVLLRRRVCGRNAGSPRHPADDDDGDNSDQGDPLHGSLCPRPVTQAPYHVQRVNPGATLPQRHRGRSAGTAGCRTTSGESPGVHELPYRRAGTACLRRNRRGRRGPQRQGEVVTSVRS